MSHETFELIARLRDTLTPAVMATLVRTHGTTPRKEGAKMFVAADGSIFGSVTIGGCVDARVLESAPEVLASMTPRLLHLQLGDEDAWDLGLTCGGAVDVFVEPVTPALLDAYERARDAWTAGQSVAIATSLTDASRSIASTGATSTDELYVEVLTPPTTLLLIGAGAVAIPLTTFAKTLGLRSVVIDSRDRFATRKRFPDADELRVGIVSEIASTIAIHPTTAIVLLAHDVKIDLPVLHHALRSEARYIGLLGSRRRGAAILQLLREEGVAEGELARIRVPVGLDLGGKSAAEIAFSIVAEVVAVLHERDGMPLGARR